MHQQVTVLAWLHFAISLLIMVIGVAVYLWMGGMGAGPASPDAGTITATPAGERVIFVFIALFGLPSAVAGFALLKRRTGARGIAILVSLINLFQFPVGSLLAANTLWTMFQASAADYFAEGPDAVEEASMR